MTRLEGPKETLARQLPHVLTTLEEGKIYILEIKRWYKPRTLNQNSLFHALVQLICRESGMDFDLVKAGLKEQYGEHVKVKIGDIVSSVAKPSSMYSTFEMGKLIDGAMLEAAELGIDTSIYAQDYETLQRSGIDESSAPLGGD